MVENRLHMYTSVELGILPTVSKPQIDQMEFPHVLPDETQETEKMIHFMLLTKIMRNQFDILHFLHCKTSSFDQLSNELSVTIDLVNSTTQYPKKEIICYNVCFIYLTFNFTIILLYRPFINNYRHHCTKAALQIQHITELVLECNAFEDMYCSIRGIQQIIHYLSAAITIFKLCDMNQQYTHAMELAYRLASTSPLTELLSKKKPSAYSQPFANQQQQQQQRKQNDNALLLNMPNHQSLLGLLMFDEDEE